MNKSDAKKLLFFIGTPAFIVSIVQIVKYIVSVFSLDLVFDLLLSFGLLGVCSVLWTVMLVSVGITPRFRWFINFTNKGKSE